MTTMNGSSYLDAISVFPPKIIKSSKESAVQAHSLKRVVLKEGGRPSAAEIVCVWKCCGPI